MAATLTAVVSLIVGDPPPVRVEFWDHSTLGPEDSPIVVRVRSVDGLRRMMWSPNQLGLARAYVAGDLDVEGDPFSAFVVFSDAVRTHRGSHSRVVLAGMVAAARLGALRRPLPPPAEEARVRGALHSPRRDSQTVRHHYDVGNDFYRLVLGEAMTYSCARYREPHLSLGEAQKAKHELICRKLGLAERSGARLLDVGCGWGSLAIHAAACFDASVVGVTLSEAQADLARRRVKQAGMGEQIEIRLQDYRDLAGERFDAISSVGMSEHVGARPIGEYFSTLVSVLAPGGRLLNHAISRPGGSTLGGPRSFMNRFVFPDGELVDITAVISAMQSTGLEVRDVESLREHYARTLRAWVDNLEANWNQAVNLVGPARAKIWKLYMTGSAIGFESGPMAIHQILAVIPTPRGSSGMPPTRQGWEST